MLTDEKLIQLKKYTVKPGKNIKLKDFDTEYDGKTLNKADSELLLENGRKHLAEVQDELYAHNRYSVLIIFQAMDAAGKDGAVNILCQASIRLALRCIALRLLTLLSWTMTTSGDTN